MFDCECEKLPHLAQVTEVSQLPSEAALVSDLRAFGAERNKIKRFEYESNVKYNA